MRQCQPWVIIWTILVVLTYLKLHTNFQRHQLISSGEEDFLRFLLYMGMAAILVMWPRPFEQFFFPKGPGSCIWNWVAIGQVVSEEKLFDIVEGQTDGRMTKPVYTISSPRAFGSDELKINNFHFFPYKSLCDQIWPWRKMGQGQPRVINWTTLVVLPYTMLHTKFQGHWSIGSGEEDYLRFLPYMGMAATLVMWPNSFV